MSLDLFLSIYRQVLLQLTKKQGPVVSFFLHFIFFEQHIAVGEGRGESVDVKQYN